MSLTFGFKSVRDLMAKLERDAIVLQEQEISGDAFFNFVITGYSMIDWVKNDNSLQSTARADIQTLYNDHNLKICGDLATASKHFTLKSRIPVASEATSNAGFGIGRYGVGRYGAGEESIEIHLSNGVTINALELIQGVLETWRHFLKTYQILN